MNTFKIKKIACQLTLIGVFLFYRHPRTVDTFGAIGVKPQVFYPIIIVLSILWVINLIEKREFKKFTIRSSRILNTGFIGIWAFLLFRDYQTTKDLSLLLSETFLYLFLLIVYLTIVKEEKRYNQDRFKNNKRSW
jgi:hypothetical protein